MLGVALAAVNVTWAVVVVLLTVSAALLVPVTGVVEAEQVAVTVRVMLRALPEVLAGAL